MEMVNKGFPHSIWFTNTKSTHMYLRLSLLHRDKGHAHIIKNDFNHTGSRLRKHQVFLITSQMVVLAPAQYKKKLISFEQLPSLYSICVAGIVFLKTSLSLSRTLTLCPDKPLHAVASTAQRLPWRFYCVLLMFLIRA
jgi:hypothetical protein